MNPQPIFCDIYDDDAYPVLCNDERDYKHLQFNKELETLLENKKFDESKELIENLDYKPLYELRKNYLWRINSIVCDNICNENNDIVKWFLQEMECYMLTIPFSYVCAFQNIELAYLFVDKDPNLFKMEVENGVITSATYSGLKVDLDLDLDFEI
jgi:hypothetical protein